MQANFALRNPVEIEPIHRIDHASPQRIPAIRLRENVISQALGAIASSIPSAKSPGCWPQSLQA